MTRTRWKASSPACSPTSTTSSRTRPSPSTLASSLSSPATPSTASASSPTRSSATSSPASPSRTPRAPPRSPAAGAGSGAPPRSSSSTPTSSPQAPRSRAPMRGASPPPSPASSPRIRAPSAASTSPAATWKTSVACSRAGSRSSPPRASRNSSSSTARGRSTSFSPPPSSAWPPSPASTSASGNSPTRPASRAPPPSRTSVNSGSAMLSSWIPGMWTSSLPGAPSWRRSVSKGICSSSSCAFASSAAASGACRSLGPSLRKSLVDAPCLERLILSGGAKLKIGHAPKLHLLGYLDLGNHVLEVGNTVIKPDTKASPSTTVPSVRILALQVRFGVRNDAKMIPALLRCFPNVETLHIMSGETDQPTGKLNLKFWHESGTIECIRSRIELLVFHDFRGDRRELSFLKFFFGSALVLKEVVIVLANESFTSVEDMHSKLEPLGSMKLASPGSSIMIAGCSDREGGYLWSFRTASDFSIDPFVN